ncbi:MAG: amidase related to nicotinamidase [Rhodospirillales bacterium]|nr:amidase related to nicotinamidase [Rhodospirillales bacterium]
MTDRGAAKGLTRDRPIEPQRTALLLVDVQNWVVNDRQASIRPEFDAAVRAMVLPNMVKLVEACRRARVEVLFTVMENLTRDGRDRSLDYKLSGISIEKGSWDAKVLELVAPDEDEIVLPKTSSSVFNSTNIDYLLRNLGVEELVVVGFLTDQCIDHTIKDAADRGYYVTCIRDACMANTHARHEAALACFAGYCRMTTTEHFLKLLAAARQ